MVKLVANYATCSLWVISVKDTAVSIINGDSVASIHLFLSILGGIYTIVLIVNKVLDGRLNRQKTKLENERLMKDIWELDENNSVDERHQ